MRVPTPPNHVELARDEVAAVHLDRRGRRRWSTAPRRIAVIVRLLRESGLQIREFALAIGMPPSVLSRFDRGLRTSHGRGRGRGHERVWTALRKLIQPRTATRGGGRTPSTTPAPEPSAGTGLRLRGDNSIEVTERRIVPYGSPEHERLLRLALAQARRAA